MYNANSKFKLVAHNRFTSCSLSNFESCYNAIGDAILAYLKERRLSLPAFASMVQMPDARVEHLIQHQPETLSMEEFLKIYCICNINIFH